MKKSISPQENTGVNLMQIYNVGKLEFFSRCEDDFGRENDRGNTLFHIFTKIAIVPCF